MLAALAALTSTVQGQVNDVLLAPRVDESHALRVHGLVEQWVRLGDVEAVDVPRVAVSEAQGVRVTLRWGGERVMGVGQVFGQEVEREEGGVVDLAAVTRLATQQALQGVRQRAQDAARRARQAGRETDEDAIYDRAIMSLLVDVQVARPPVEVQVPLHDALTVPRLFASGYHGLMLTAPETTAMGVLWPASVLAANVPANHQVMQLLVQVGLPMDDTAAVGQPGGPTLYRFNVIHVVRPRPDQPATTLTRGNVLISAQEFDTPTLEAMGDRMTANLARRLGMQRAEPAEEGAVLPPPRMAGTYLPTTGEYDPPYASPEELALTAYVLARRARMLAAVHGGGAAYRQTTEAAQLAVGQLERIMFVGASQMEVQHSPLAAALTLMSLIETPGLADRKAMRDRLALQLMRLQDDDGLFLASDAPDAQPLHGAGQSLLLSALASLYDHTRDALIGQMVMAARQPIWDMVAEEETYASMPWLMLAEKKIAPLLDEAAAGGEEVWQPRDVVRHMANLAMRYQVTAHLPAAQSPADVVGGFEFEEMLLGAAPHPTWETAEVLAFLAQALRDDALIDDEQRLEWLLRCGQAGRFIAQLMFDEPSCYYVRGPSEALGAVRAALDDNRLHVTATALSLLAVTELQQTFHEMAAASR